MFGINFNNNNHDDNKEKGELEQFFEDEDWDIGQKGGEVDKEGDIDWSNYDFMHTFDDLSNSNNNLDKNEETDIT